MPRREEKSVTRTGCEIFADGSALELIRIPNDELGLLSWNGTSAETAQQFVRQGKIFAPLKIDATAQRFLRLPDGVADHGSTQKLFADVAAFISRATQESEDIVQILTFFILATWLADRAPSPPPFLWIVTPPTTTWAPLAQVLGILCRRAFFVSDLSPVGLRSLPTGLGPALLTQMVSPTKRDLGVLRMATRHGALIAPGGQFVDLCCSQVVFSPEPVRDPASAGFPLELVLSPARTFIPLMNAAEVESMAAEYQSKFLHYRLVHLTKVHAPAFDLNQFAAPLRDLACALGAGIVDDDDLQARIIQLLQPVDSEIRTTHASLLTAICIEALLAECHMASGRYFPVADLTANVNTILAGRGEREVSPEKIGWALRALGLHTAHIPGGRKGIVVSSEVRTKIHRLAAAYGVRTLRESSATVENCGLCRALEMPWKAGLGPEDTTVTSA